MINLSNIMNSVEQEKIALEKATSILMAVHDAAHHSPNNPKCYEGAIYAAEDIVSNTVVMLEVLRDGISNHLQAERKNITNEKGGTK